jgi:hypothetical protein
VEKRRRELISPNPYSSDSHSLVERPLFTAHTALGCGGRRQDERMRDCSTLSWAHPEHGNLLAVVGDSKSSLGDAKSSLGDAKSLRGDAKSSRGDAKSSLGDAKSSPGDAKSSLGDAESLRGDAKSSRGDT